MNTREVLDIIRYPEQYSVQRKIEIVIELLDEIADELKIDPAKGKITIEKISEMELYELEKIDPKEVEEFRLEWIMKGKG